MIWFPSGFLSTWRLRDGARTLSAAREGRRGRPRGRRRGRPRVDMDALVDALVDADVDADVDAVVDALVDADVDAWEAARGQTGIFLVRLDEKFRRTRGLKPPRACSVMSAVRSGSW
ncbi:hypothetical protein GBF38_001243 [Nibea albiflora]|uniref:Uncharacterized protein n=1 Tax=Nibea albiflora TaxID=240163 RepID=A0ACB7ETA9_NIBAL|nr:hypothetical protein GBF38_001243 [Nibea albiflora]